MGTPVGYRFQPKDEEIITLLNKKMLDPDFSVQTINEVDIYNFEPFDLPRLSAIQSDEVVSFFFCAPYYKYANSKRANRRTNMGYWKVTGKGCKIFAKRSKDMIGSKKFLVFCEHGYASKKHKAEWVMHEFRSEYNPPNKVETQQLPGHLQMTYGFRNHVAENSFVRVEPQLPNRHFPSDSRNHVAEKTVQGVEHEELANMTSNYRNHVAENSFSMEESQLLPNQYVAFNSRNHVAEKIFPEVEYQLPSQYLTSDYRNHSAENILARVECHHIPGDYFNLTSGYRNHVAEKNFPRDEPQPVASHRLASQPRNHVAENTCPWIESQQLPSYSLIPDFRDQVAEHSLSGVESLLLEQFDALYLCNGLNYNTLPALQSPINVEDVVCTGSNGLDHNTFFALQSPIYPEQGSSSYSDGFINDCNVLNFQFGSEQEDMNSQVAFQDKYPPEETGQILPSGFSSSKSVTEVHFEDGSDTDIETIKACFNGCSPIAAGDYFFYSICEPQINYAGEY